MDKLGSRLLLNDYSLLVCVSYLPLKLVAIVLLLLLLLGDTAWTLCRPAVMTGCYQCTWAIILPTLHHV